MRKVRFVMNLFAMITTCVLTAVGVITTVISPVEKIESYTCWQILVVSFLCAVSTLVYPWDRVMKKGEFYLRGFLHYLMINAIVLGAGQWFGWYDVSNPFSVLVMVIIIAIIFVVVSAISWKKSKADADAMNERLLEYQRRNLETGKK